MCHAWSDVIPGTRRTIITNGRGRAVKLAGTGDPRFRRALQKGLKLRHNLAHSASELDDLTVTFYHRMNIADIAYHGLYYRAPSEAPNSLVSAHAKGTTANSTVVAYLEPGQWDAEPTGRLYEDGTPEFRACEESTGEVQTFAIVPLQRHHMHCNHVRCRNDPMVGVSVEGQWQCKTHGLRYRCCPGNPDREGNIEVIAFIAKLPHIGQDEDYPRLFRVGRPNRLVLETIDVDRHFRRKLHYQDDPGRAKRVQDINASRARARMRAATNPLLPRTGESHSAYAARKAEAARAKEPLAVRPCTFVVELSKEVTEEDGG